RATAPSGMRRKAAPVKPGSLARLRYRFDNALSRGPFIVIAYLGGLTLFVVFLVALVATLTEVTFGGGLNHNFTEDLWQSMLRVLDSGTFAADGPWPTRLLALLVTLAGIFLAGSLIGLIANAVDQRVEELRRGHSAVIEEGHTLILGWSPQVPRVIAELVIANESESDASIVVLCRADKSVVEDTIRDRVPECRTTRVVCRNGDPAAPDDLERACIATARSIVVVRDDDGDAGVVKAILAIRALDTDLAQCHVVAEVRDPDNARTLRAVTRGRVLTISSDDIVAEVTAQACQQSGLAAVFAELLDFDGAEIYFASVPEVAGRTYADAQLAFEHSSVIGRLTSAGAVELNPSAATVINADDELIVVAEDDSAIVFTGVLDVTAPTVPIGSDASGRPMRVLIVGWSGFGTKVLQQLDEFLPAGSTVDLQVDRDLSDPSAIDAFALANATLAVHPGRGGPEDLLALGELQPFDQVVVLAYRDALSADDADARTLLTLLTLRMVWPMGDSVHVRIVAELMDQKNLAIASPVGVDDLIVSDALASLMIAQLAERAELQAVFEDLFDPEGAVVELRPAADLVPPTPLSFATIVAAAAAQEASAFGYRRAASGEVVVNPPKSTMLTLADDDQVLVIGFRTPTLA
ncbi:MAG: NAD-binding protein, partial [Acidimicrobiales bacterium]